MFALTMTACQSGGPDSDKGKDTTAGGSSNEPNMSSEEIVFDPRNPPLALPSVTETTVTVQVAALLPISRS